MNIEGYMPLIKASVGFFLYTMVELAILFVGISFLDGIGNGLGYSLVLIIVATIRELFGTGSLLEYKVLPLVSEGGWFEPNLMLLLPPSAFFIIGFLIWGIRSWKKVQIEEPDYRPITVSEMRAE